LKETDSKILVLLGRYRFVPRSFAMRATRSSTRQAGVKEHISLPVDEAKKPRARKRKAEDEQPTPSKLAKVSPPQADDAAVVAEEALVPAVLSFDFETAKAHLIQVDGRFEDLFSKLTCKPFEHLEAVHPFRYVTRLSHALELVTQPVDSLQRARNFNLVRMSQPSHAAAEELVKGATDILACGSFDHSQVHSSVQT